MDGREDHYDAKFTVLAENVRHRIKEEENEVFPKANDASIDFEALSKAMVQRKETLLAKGVPPDSRGRDGRCEPRQRLLACPSGT